MQAPDANEPPKTVLEFLEKVSMSKFHDVLENEHGFECLEDLVECTNEEIDSLALTVGFKLGEKKRFQRALKNLRRTYTPGRLPPSSDSVLSETSATTSENSECDVPHIQLSQEEQQDIQAISTLEQTLAEAQKSSAESRIQFESQRETVRSAIADHFEQLRTHLNRQEGETVEKLRDLTWEWLDEYEDEVALALEEVTQAKAQCSQSMELPELERKKNIAQAKRQCQRHNFLLIPIEPPSLTFDIDQKFDMESPIVKVHDNLNEHKNERYDYVRTFDEKECSSLVFAQRAPSDHIGAFVAADKKNFKHGLLVGSRVVSINDESVVDSLYNTICEKIEEPGSTPLTIRFEKEYDLQEKWGLANAKKEQSNKEFGNGNVPESIALLNEAIDLHPTNKVYYSNRAMMFKKRKDFELALADCDRVLETDPDHLKVLYLRGLILADLKRTKEALKMFERVLEMDVDGSFPRLKERVQDCRKKLRKN